MEIILPASALRPCVGCILFELDTAVVPQLVYTLFCVNRWEGNVALLVSQNELGNDPLFAIFNKCGLLLNLENVRVLQELP